MSFICKELSKEFTTREELIKALRENKEELISLKKASIKTSDSMAIVLKSEGAEKESNNSNLLQLGDRVPAVINTTNYLDSHMDVHIDGIWNKSAKEQNGKTYHIINHDLSIGSIIAYPKDVDISVRSVKWSQLGRSYSGKTEALVFDSKMTDKTNKDAFMAYRDGEPVEHSIRMRYIKYALAFKSDESEDKVENALYEKHINNIVNKEVAEEFGYFWVVSEARIEKEGSMVLFGSNDATPVLQEKLEPSDIDTLNKIEPLLINSTQLLEGLLTKFNH